MRNRYYSPATGRFISEDPIGLAGGSNLYRYAGNAPTYAKDPSGNFAMALGAPVLFIPGVGEGLLIGVGVTVVTLGAYDLYLHMQNHAADASNGTATPSGIKNNPAANGGCSANIVCNQNNSDDGSGGVSKGDLKAISKSDLQRLAGDDGYDSVEAWKQNELELDSKTDIMKDNNNDLYSVPKKGMPGIPQRIGIKL